MLKNPFRSGQARHDLHGVASRFLGCLDRPAIVADAEGVIRYMNEPAEHLTAWREADALGRPLGAVLRLTGRAVGKSVVEHLGQALMTGKAIPLGGDTVLIRADGAPVAVEGSVAPMHGARHRLMSWYRQARSSSPVMSRPHVR